MRLCLKMEEEAHPKLSSDLYMGTEAHASQHTNTIYTQVKLKNNEQIKIFKKKKMRVYGPRECPSM